MVRVTARKRVSYLHPGPYPVYIGFTDCPQAFAREVKRLKIDDPPQMLGHERANMTTHIFENKGTLCFIIAAQPYTRKVSREQYAALIAHEAMHVVQEMQRELARGNVFDDESGAYLLQHITQHCLQQAWQTGRVRKTTPDA